jgi:DNA-binding NarL/FixJ family response regulator
MRAARAPKRKVRILLADQEGVFRLGLKKLFGVEDDLRVVAQADSSGQIGDLAVKFRPDVLFVQAEMLGSNPHEFVGQLHKSCPAGKIVITASALSGEDAPQFVKAGAAGAILKSSDPALFLKCVREVVKGHLWLSAEEAVRLTAIVKEREPRAARPVETLTRREKAIISCLVQGWRNREIALHLTISEQTVKNHLRTIYDKVGVSDRLELALYAIHHRLELPPVAPASTP